MTEPLDITRDLARTRYRELTNGKTPGELTPEERAELTGLIKLINAVAPRELSGDESAAWGAFTGAEPPEPIHEAPLIARLWQRVTVAVQPLRRGRGRPRGTDVIPPEEFEDKLLAAYRAVEGRADERPTQADVAAELGVDRKTLAKFLKRDGLPWPPR